jgi:hypothetical protein
MVKAKISDDQLVSELWARDVRFLMRQQSRPTPLLPPANLIAALAQSESARVRLSLIPVFLRHPEFAAEAEKADEALLTGSNRLALRFYYTAALILQGKYWDRLNNLLNGQTRLPDLFSKKIGVVINEDHNESLSNLSKCHQILSGHFINWLGTYEHAAERLIKHMEKFG